MNHNTGSSSLAFITILHNFMFHMAMISSLLTSNWRLSRNKIFSHAFTTTIPPSSITNHFSRGISCILIPKDFSTHASSCVPTFVSYIQNSSIGSPRSMQCKMSRNQSTTSNKKTRTRLQAQNQSNNDDPELHSFIQKVTSTDDFFASKEFPTFESIGVKSPILLKRVHQVLQREHGELPKPSAVQAASYTALMSGNDVTIGAETGSGKTLAYLLPILDDILESKRKSMEIMDEQHEEFENEDDRFSQYEYARAVILVPNKELASQVIRMATPLCGGEDSIVWGTNGERISNLVSGPPEKQSDESEQSKGHEMIRIGFLPGELKSPDDYKPFRLASNDPTNNPPLDILVCTPASLGPWGLNPKNINVFADIQTIVIDEADMLFDGGYLRQLENTLLGFKRADRLDASFGVAKTQHVLVAATLPSMGTKSVDAYVQRKFPYATRVTMKGMHNARHYGLGTNTVWVEDGYEEMTPKKKRMEQLVKMLKSNQSSNDIGDACLAGEKVIIFLNNVNDVDSATNALRRSGIEAVPFHAKMPIQERTENLNRFRKFVAGQSIDDNSDAISVLVCTDLAARGLDIPGVTAVVQLQFAGNVVTHLHRMGRCGRAGNRDGRGVIFYGGVETELVRVIRDAEKQQQTMVLKGSDIEDVNEEVGESGKVQAAFSRKRGFTRKRKKLRRAAFDTIEDEGIYY